MACKLPTEEPEVAETNVGLLFNDNIVPLLSFKISTRVSPVRLNPPVFLTVIVKTIISFTPFEPSPLSVTVAVLTTFIDGCDEVIISVESSWVLPSPSSPSSEVSETLLVCPGLLPLAITWFLTLPEFAASRLIV